jgi:putative transposase
MILTQVFRATQPKSLLDECNMESGRIYTRTMVEHWRVYRNHEVWLSAGMDEKYNDFLYPTTLHAHSRDAAQQAFAKAVKTTHALRKAGYTDAQFPHKTKYWKTTIWKNTGIRVRDGVAFLARARGLEPICVELPLDLQHLNFVEARLVYNHKTSRYEWHFVIDDGIEPIMRTEGASVAVDMGEIHPAVVTDGNTGLVISARELRSTGQGLAKAISILDARKSRMKKGSLRYRRMAKAKAKARRVASVRQRDILHKVSRAVVDYAEEAGAKEIIIGDVRDIADGIDIGKHSNQKISLWPHGKLRSYIAYKALMLGMETLLEDEHHTTQTCPNCGSRKKPSGRIYSCGQCGFVGHRDVVGASNILSHRLLGELGRVQVNETMYRHPYKVWSCVAAFDTAQVARLGEKPPSLPQALLRTAGHV